jgi:hypothetical protein
MNMWSQHGFMEDRIQALGDLRCAFARRGLNTAMSDKSHWFSVEPIPTLTCCEYLGMCEITLNDFGCYTWLDGRAERMNMVREFTEAVVSEVIRTRAGLPGDLRIPYPSASPAPTVPSWMPDPSRVRDISSLGLAR